MVNKSKLSLALGIALALAGNASVVMAQDKSKGKSEDSSNGSAAACKQVSAAIGTSPGGIHAALQAALTTAVAAETSGLDLNSLTVAPLTGIGKLDMWATLVNRDGVVCAVAFSGANRNSQWPGSRAISAQKANTANAFSLDTLALSSANLYSAVQPGGSLFGLQESNPVATDVVYHGPASKFGKKNDPMVGEHPGGVNVFGGGLGLYNVDHKVIGGVGLSGDTSCADHNIAWRVRNILKLDNLLGVGGVGPAPTHADGIVFDIDAGASAGGFGHPTCIKSDNATAVATNAASQTYAATLPPVDH